MKIIVDFVSDVIATATAAAVGSTVFVLLLLQLLQLLLLHLPLPFLAFFAAYADAFVLPLPSCPWSTSCRR